MVRTITGRMRLNIVPSGSEVNKFGLSKSDPRELLKLAYVGRLDKKRDVSSIFQLSKSLKKSGLKHHITVAGKGDMEKIFHRKSGDIEELSYLGEISHEEVAKILAEQHVGIMPMPGIPIWEISSPIKLAEYTASGLAVIGPEHEGNILGDGGEWCILSKKKTGPKSVSMIYWKYWVTAPGRKRLCKNHWRPHEIILGRKLLQECRMS